MPVSSLWCERAFFTISHFTRHGSSLYWSGLRSYEIDLGHGKTQISLLGFPGSYCEARLVLTRVAWTDNSSRRKLQLEFCVVVENHLQKRKRQAFSTRFLTAFDWNVHEELNRFTVVWHSAGSSYWQCTICGRKHFLFRRAWYLFPVCFVELTSENWKISSKHFVLCGS